MRRAQRYLLSTLLLLLPFSLITSCVATHESTIVDEEDEGPVDLEIVAQFPADWLPKIEHALLAFRDARQKDNCFTVTIGRDEAVNLDFVSISPTVNLTPAGGFGRVDGCGIGVAYYFNDNGDFVRSEIQR